MTRPIITILALAILGLDFKILAAIAVVAGIR